MHIVRNHDFPSVEAGRRLLPGLDDSIRDSHINRDLHYQPDNYKISPSSGPNAEQEEEKQDEEGSFIR